MRVINHICGLHGALLQLKKGDRNFGKACRAEVERYEQESAKDFRLNYRLYDACKADVGQICRDACQLQDGEICGGKVGLCCLSACVWGVIPLVQLPHTAWAVC